MEHSQTPTADHVRSDNIVTEDLGGSGELWEVTMSSEHQAGGTWRLRSLCEAEPVRLEWPGVGGPRAGMCCPAVTWAAEQTKTQLGFSSSTITSDILGLVIDNNNLSLMSLVVKGRRKGYFKRRHCLRDAYTHTQSQTRSQSTWLVSGEGKNINCIGKWGGTINRGI